MTEVKSGKELCDEFFRNLLQKENIDVQITNLIADLYNNGKFTKEEILQSLELLRKAAKIEQ